MANGKYHDGCDDKCDSEGSGNEDGSFEGTGNKIMCVAVNVEVSYSEQLRQWR